MLKTTLSIQNNSSSKVNCVSVGAVIRVPALSTITKVVDESKADAIKVALAAKYPALIVTETGDYDDGVAYPYMPFVKNKLIAAVAPDVTDDTSSGYSVGSVWINTTAEPKEIYQCVDATHAAAVWLNLTAYDGQAAAVDKTPVNAVAAAGTFTAQAGGATITDDSTITIGTKTYTWKTVLGTTEGQVLIGANDTAALLNLKNAINLTVAAGTYYCAAAHPTVTGTSSNATTIVVTAKTKGVAGNAIATTKTGAGTGAWGAATLAGGVDGTVGYANETCSDGSYLYRSIGASTISDANWRRVSLGSVY